MEELEKTQPLKFQHPDNIVLYGKTFSGETIFLLNLLFNANKLFKTKDGKEMKTIFYCYGSVWHLKFDILGKNGIAFFKGLPTGHIR